MGQAYEGSTNFGVNAKFFGETTGEELSWISYDNLSKKFLVNISQEVGTALGEVREVKIVMKSTPRSNHIPSLPDFKFSIFINARFAQLGSLCLLDLSSLCVMESFSMNDGEKRVEESTKIYIYPFNTRIKLPQFSPTPKCFFTPLQMSRQVFLDNRISPEDPKTLPSWAFLSQDRTELLIAVTEKDQVE